MSEDLVKKALKITLEVNEKIKDLDDRLDAITLDVNKLFQLVNKLDEQLYAIQNFIGRLFYNLRKMRGEK